MGLERVICGKDLWIAKQWTLSSRCLARHTWLHWPFVLGNRPLEDVSSEIHQTFIPISCNFRTQSVVQVRWLVCGNLVRWAGEE